MTQLRVTVGGREIDLLPRCTADDHLGEPGKKGVLSAGVAGTSDWPLDWEIKTSWILFCLESKLFWCLAYPDQAHHPVWAASRKDPLLDPRTAMSCDVWTRR